MELKFLKKKMSVNKKPPPPPLYLLLAWGFFFHKKCMNFLFLNLLSSKRAQSSSFYRADPTENWPEITLWRTETVFYIYFGPGDLKKYKNMLF